MRAGPDFVSKWFVPPKCWNLVKPSRDPALVAATGELVAIQGLILLHIRLGDFFDRTWFVVVPRLALQMFICNCFIDRFIKGIFP